MKRTFPKKAFGLIAAVVLFASSGLVLITAHQEAPAARISLSFDDYHGYTEVVRYLNQVAAAYPEIAGLEEIGRSHFGRPILVLAITNKKTGATLESRLAPLTGPSTVPAAGPALPASATKPGHWICGSTHGNEFTGTEVCLYIIDRLLEGYDSDPAIKALIDRAVFYICPVVNPDGHFNSLERGISQRANSRLRDDDRDGLVNEDGPDDLDDDGVIAQFRFRDPKGRFVVDEADPRLMVRLGNEEKTTRPTYSVVNEDRDNDRDGRRGEDPEAGIDINRNFPLKWFKDDGTPGGTGDFPASSPEVKAFVDFFLAHRNILLGQNYHTSGGFTFRPMGSAPHSTLHPKDVAVLDFIMGKRYLEIIGEEVPEAWKAPEDLDKFKAALAGGKNKSAAARGYEFPRGWRVSYDELTERQYGYGLSTDWEYREHGSFSITTELWNQNKDIPGFPALPAGASMADRQRALLKFQDERYGGRLFIPWRPFHHPELGDGEIGGWNPRYQSNAWPGDPLRHVCEMHSQFELFRAGLLPEIVVAESNVRVLRATNDRAEADRWKEEDVLAAGTAGTNGRFKALEVTARIENRGALATHLARGLSIPGNREDLAWLVGEREKLRFVGDGPMRRLGVLGGAMKVPGYGATPSEEPSRSLRWLVVVEGDTPLQIVVSSQKGGAQTVEVPPR